MHPDQKYIDALLNNDIKLLSELYQKCFPLIRNMVMQNSGSEATAADIFQESLIDLFKKVKIHQFTLTFSVCAYIKGMCTYKLRDEIKKRKREGVTFIDFSGHKEIGEDCFAIVEEHYLKQARLDLVRKNFKNLGESCKELLRLSWMKTSAGKRKSTEEIARSLNITDGYARKKKSECIVKLIKLVMNDPEFGEVTY